MTDHFILIRVTSPSATSQSQEGRCSTPPRRVQSSRRLRRRRAVHARGSSVSLRFLRVEMIEVWRTRPSRGDEPLACRGASSLFWAFALRAGPILRMPQSWGGAYFWAFALRAGPILRMPQSWGPPIFGRSRLTEAASNTALLASVEMKLGCAKAFGSLLGSARASKR